MMWLYRISYFFVLVAACEREPAETLKEVPVPRGGAAGTSSRAENDEDSTGAGGGGSTASATTSNPDLPESHPGYGQATCFDCHGTVAPYPHATSTFRPPDCVVCHGDNGAPHREHAVVENPGCPSCHTTVAHVLKFSAPFDCVACHSL